MSAETDSGLTFLSFDSPAPSGKTFVHDREHNISVIRGYVIDGGPLEAEAIDDMMKNPEALSLQVSDLGDWVGAAEAGEEGVWASRYASSRLKFLRMILDWSVEMGNGSDNFRADRTAGNGYDGIPACTSLNINSRGETIVY